MQAVPQRRESFSFLPGNAVLRENDPLAGADCGTFAYRILPPRAVDVRLQRGRPAFVGARTVLECAGPWRVDEAWWSAALQSGAEALAQDAYDVLLDDGALCRIFEERGRWYLGGMYD